jgi:hypothetical protein
VKGLGLLGPGPPSLSGIHQACTQGRVARGLIRVTRDRSAIHQVTAPSYTYRSKHKMLVYMPVPATSGTRSLPVSSRQCKAEYERGPGRRAPALVLTLIHPSA